MPGKKDLYLGKNIGDLNKMAEVNSQKLTNVRLVVRTTEKMFKSAEEAELLGDEERAYVLYMKFFYLISSIKKTTEYKNNEKYYKELIGTKKTIKAIDEAEKLSKSLKDRYDYKEAEEVKKKLDAIDKKREEGAAKEAENKKNEEKEEKVEEKVPEKPGVIKVKKLYELLKDTDTEILLMDVRTKEEFEQSRIRHKLCINVPAAIVPPGSVVSKIEKLLAEDIKDVWNKRANFDYIVLVDWKSSSQSLESNTTIRCLKDALYKWDSYTILKSEPLVLDGGYEEWLLYYPMKSTNANVNIPSSKNVYTSAAPALDSFDYPDLEEAFKETPKKSDVVNGTRGEDTDIDSQAENILDDLKSTKPSVPSVNRATKPKNTNKDIKPEVISANKEVQEDTVLNNIRSTKSETSVNEMKNLPDLVVNLPKSVKTQNTEEQILPKVNRALKPNTSSSTFSLKPDTVPSASSVKPDVSSSSSSTTSPGSADLVTGKGPSTSLTPESENFNALKLEREKELKELQKKKEGVMLEHQARLSKLNAEKESIEKLRSMKKNEERELAELMRKKQQITAAINAEMKRMEEETAASEVLEKQRIEELKSSKTKETKESVKSDQEINRDQTERKEDQEDTVNQIKSQKENEAEQEKEKEQKRLEAERERERREALRKEQALKEAREKAEAEAKAKAAVEARAKQLEEKLAAEKAEKEAKLLQKQSQAEKSKSQSEISHKGSMKVETSRDKLPVGWEKRFDENSGKYYYIDHNLGKTHWEMPSNLANLQDQKASNLKVSSKPGGIFTTKLRDEPSTPKSHGLARSHSSPNIAKMMQDEEEASHFFKPSIDRTLKPARARPEMISAKPQITEINAARIRNLQPIYGSVGRGLTGLRNLGNTCYMNSIIQSLNNTTPLVSYFLNDNFKYDINRHSKLGHKGEVVDEFAVVIKALWSGQYRSIGPRDLKMVAGKHMETFAGYSQQDSQEFLLFLMDSLHEDLNRVKVKPVVKPQDNDRLSDMEAGDLAWRTHKKLNESIIVELFQGQFKSTVRCLKCSKQSVTFDVFMYLSLPLPKSTRCTIQDCLRKFSTEEKMSGASKWFCPRCKELREAVKTIVIWKLPNILLIHLKRFSFEGVWKHKLNHYVDFPLTNMDISEYVAGPKPKNDYSLYALSNHYGTMEGGHYTAYGKNPYNSKWYKFDDHEVFEMSRSDIKSSAAYTLFYTSVANSLNF